MKKYLILMVITPVALAIFAHTAVAAQTHPIGVAVAAEKWCTDHKEHSCTKEAKRGLKNLGAYLSGKKDPGKSLECKFRKVRNKIFGKKRVKC